MGTHIVLTLAISLVISVIFAWFHHDTLLEFVMRCVFTGAASVIITILFPPNG